MSLLHFLLVVMYIFATCSTENTVYKIRNEGVTKPTNKYEELVDKLFRGSLRTPPGSEEKHLRRPINLTMKVTIDSLLHLSMRQETFVAALWFQVEWVDEQFEWNERVYPFSQLVLNETWVWRPPLAVANAISKRDGVLRTKLPVEVTSNGQFRWYPGNTLALHCPVDIRYYPFDVQTCNVRVAQWSTSEHESNCTEASWELYTRGNGQWDIVRTGITRHAEKLANGATFWHMDFSLTLKRKWTFYAMNVLFPVVLVSGLNCVVFLLPVECGEKMSVSVTTFLTLAVFMSIIDNSLTNNSDHICYLAVYLIVQMTFGAMAVVLSALQVECYHKDVAETFNQEDDETLSVNLSSESSETLSKKSITEEEDARRRKRKERPGQKSRTRAILKRCTHMAAEMDFYCFPLLLVGNIVSIVTFILVIYSGPISAV